MSKDSFQNIQRVHIFVCHRGYVPDHIQIGLLNPVFFDDFPESEFASTSVFSIADYYYNIQEYQLALENYEMVLEHYGDTEVAEKVPETLKDLKETIAYIEYEKGWNLFSQAQDTKDPNFYRQASEIFQSIVENYPETEAEIGAYSNLGICL